MDCETLRRRILSGKAETELDPRACCRSTTNRWCSTRSRPAPQFSHLRQMGIRQTFRGEQTHFVDSARICSRLPSRAQNAQVLYKTTDFYAPEHEHTLASASRKIKMAQRQCSRNSTAIVVSTSTALPRD